MAPFFRHYSQTLIMAKNSNQDERRDSESPRQERNSGNDRVADAQKRNDDTSRTSSQGRKEASGGSADTNNQGRPKGR